MAAISATMVWEVRSTGSDSNGGGFDPGVTSPGTDYSQQTSPQVTYTDLVIGATTTQCTSVLNPFSSAHVGNTINISSGTGFTVQIVEILSVSGIIATCNISLGTAASTGGHGKLGGCFATIAQSGGVAVASNTVWIKATANYTVTAVLALNQSTGFLQSPTSFIGYTTTRGDGGQITWTTSTNSTVLVNPSSALGLSFQNIKFTTTAGTPAAAISPASANASNLSFVNCYFSGFTHAIYSDYGVPFGIVNLLVDSCEITGCTSDGITNAGGTTVIASYIHANTGCGINQATASQVAPVYLNVLYSVIKSNAGTAGVQVSGTSNPYVPTIILNSVLINNTGDGLRMAGSGAGDILLLWNSIIDTNGGYGIRYSIGNSGLFWGPSFRNNAYGSGSTANTSGDLGGGAVKDASDVVLTADPFTSRSTGDFSLNSTTGGGVACKGAGYPTVIPG
jgi:hypothetical protein